MADGSPGTDWYDWLAENEEIKGGKVRVLGLPRDRLHLGRREGTVHSARPADRGQEEWLDAGRSSHDTSFEQVLADLCSQDRQRAAHVMHGGAAGGPQCNAPDTDSGLHTNGSRSEQFYTYMVRREMQATEDRILERVLVGADDQMRLAERRILHNVNCSMARVSSLLSNSDGLRHAVKRLRASNRELNLRLSEITISLRDEISNTSVTV